MRGTSNFHWISRQGQTGDAFVSDDKDQVSYKYFRKDGDGTFQISFEEYQDISESVRIQERTDLRWGSSFIVAPEQSEKITKIVFDAFNGDHVEFLPQSDDSNPFISLQELDGSFEIKAKRASEINQTDVQALSKRVAQINLSSEK